MLLMLTVKHTRFEQSNPDTLKLPEFFGIQLVITVCCASMHQLEHLFT